MTIEEHYSEEQSLENRENENNENIEHGDNLTDLNVDNDNTHHIKNSKSEAVENGKAQAKSLELNSMSIEPLKLMLEAALISSHDPLTVQHLHQLFDESMRPTTEQIRHLLKLLQEDYQHRSFELVEVASGYRLQVKTDYAPALQRMHIEKPSRYSRAVLETLAIIAYRQPVTRAEIEAIRGVAVGTHVVKTLTDREWIKVIGYRDVPGKPALYVTTKQFLDYFSLKSLEELPTLKDIQNLNILEAIEQ